MGLIELKAKQNDRMASVALPGLPDDVTNAERAHAEIAADLATARADFGSLNMNFDQVELRRVDGTLFPVSNRDAILVQLFRRVSELENAQEAARRKLQEARRAFSENASRAITPGADAICEEAITHLDQAMNLLDVLGKLNTEASQSGLTIKHRQIGRAAGIARQLYDIRRILAPVPIGAR